VSDKKEKFDKLQQEQRDLDESYQQSKRNKKERQDIINTIISNDKKADLVTTILERKRREMIIEKENEEYLKEIQKKL
jgi:hypothetical protein|tara:strand:+ start:282 stop:515 length:234 start_codon:yes stop_codon:yes gene_type:complete